LIFQIWKKKIILVDNFSEPKLENRKEHAKLKGIEKALNIWRPCIGMKV
jgi:hypothetical protein